MQNKTKLNSSDIDQRLRFSLPFLLTSSKEQTEKVDNVVMFVFDLVALANCHHVLTLAELFQTNLSLSISTLSFLPYYHF